jgi:outer membrane protein assembly factor BamB
LDAYADSIENSDSWPMFKHDPQHTGYSSSNAPNTNETKWFYNASGAGSSPAVANGRVIFLSARTSQYGSVLALNSTTGEKLWSYDTFDSIDYVLESTPAIDMGRVYISGLNHNVFFLNETTGALLWKYLADASIDSSPLVSNGKVFFGSADTLYCLNADDGTLVWNSTMEFQYSLSSPAIWNNVIFIGCTTPYYEMTFYAINAFTGVKIWDYNVTGYFTSSSPVVDDEKVFFASHGESAYGGKVYCLDATTGTLIWNTPGEIDFRSSPTVANGKVFIGDYSDNPEGKCKLYCFNAATGSSIWNLTDIAWISGSPAVAYGKVFFGTADAKFYCLDENTGSELWSYQTIGIYFSSPAVSDGTVFVGFEGGRGYELGFGGVCAFGAKYRTRLSLSLDSETSLLGFKVNLTGTLEGNGTAIEDASVLLSYSVTGGETWTDITVAHTDADGRYSAVWIPSATGTYLVKASWTQYPTYEEGEALRMLSVNTFDDQNVFSVTSNSTLSALAFDSATHELRFTVTGETGTTGFVTVKVAKSLVANVADLKVYLDDTSLDYTVQSADDSWVLYFTYAHSTHSVTVNLGAASSPIIWFIAVAVVVSVVAVCLLLYFKKRNTK